MFKYFNGQRVFCFLRVKEGLLLIDQCMLGNVQKNLVAIDKSDDVGDHMYPLYCICGYMHSHSVTSNIHF